jgi:multiple sugar transport system permease protein
VLNWIERLDEQQFAYVMLAPAFTLVGLIAVWPLVETFRVSLFADSSVQYVGGFAGVDNYVQILTGAKDYIFTRPFFDLSKPFRSALPVTVIIALVSVLFASLIGIGQAVILDREFRQRDLVRAIIILPWTLPVVVYGMVVFLFFQPGFGLGADLLGALGGSGAPLANAVESSVVIIIAYTWRGAPFIALLVLAGLQSIDRTLYDVARISGATRWQQFTTITFPLIRPSLLVAALFTTIAGLKIFGIVVTAIGGCNTVVVLSCIVFNNWVSQRFGTAAALAFLTALIIGVISMFYLVRLREDMR